jgi:hypothetical protein
MMEGLHSQPGYDELRRRRFGEIERRKETMT